MPQRKFRIEKIKHITGYWMLSMNGQDVKVAKSWQAAFQYLREHWYCECLGMGL